MSSIAKGKISIQDVKISEWDITSDNISKLQFTRDGVIYDFPSSDAINYPIFDSLSGITILYNGSYFFEQLDLVHFVLDLKLSLTQKIQTINLPLPYIAMHSTIGHIDIMNGTNYSESTTLGSCTINDSLTHIQLKSNIFDPIYMPNIRIRSSIIYKRDISVS